MSYWAKLFGKKLSRDAVVNEVNGKTDSVLNPKTKSEALAISMQLIEVWHKYGMQQPVYLPDVGVENLDSIISKCPKLWEAYIIRAEIKNKMITNKTFASLLVEKGKRTGKRIPDYYYGALKDYSKGFSQIEKVSEICKLDDFENRFQFYKRNWESLKDYWLCQSCGRCYPKTETRCVYDSCN